MKQHFRENVCCEIAITAPGALNEQQIYNKLLRSKWSYQIDLMFDIQVNSIKIAQPALLSKRGSSSDWQISFQFDISLRSIDPIPDGYYDPAGTIEYLEADILLPNGFSLISQTSFTII